MIRGDVGSKRSAGITYHLHTPMLINKVQLLCRRAINFSCNVYATEKSHEVSLSVFKSHHESKSTKHCRIKNQISCLARLLAPLILSPYLYSTNGIGMKTHPKNAKRELAQPTPNLVYIAVAKSGNPAPKDDRIKSLPASTLAAYFGYASGR